MLVPKVYRFRVNWKSFSESVKFMLLLLTDSIGVSIFLRFGYVLYFDWLSRHVIVVLIIVFRPIIVEPRSTKLDYLIWLQYTSLK